MNWFYPKFTKQFRKLQSRGVLFFPHLIFIIVLEVFLVEIAAAQKPVPQRDFEIKFNLEEASSMIGDKRISNKSNFPLAIYNAKTKVNLAEPEVMARQYLNISRQSLGIGESDVQNLELHAVRKSETGTTVRLRQFWRQIPVYNAEIAITINPKNVVTFVMNSFKYDLRPDNTNPKLSVTQARQIVLDYLNVSGGIIDEAIELTIVPYDQKADLFYRLRIATEQPLGDWEVLVNAQSGSILMLEDKACYYREHKNALCNHNPPLVASGTGSVFDPDPLSSSGATYADPGFTDNSDLNSSQLGLELQVKTLLDITQSGGTYSLVGPWAEIQDFESPNKGLFTQATPDWLVDRQDDAFEAVNTYYHIDASMRYLNLTLGLGIMPYQYSGGVRFDPHGLNGADNSHYLGGSGRLAFGEGGVDDAEDSDVIHHELGHGLHDWVTAGGLSQVNGLSEGCGDYWAASYNRSLGDWTSSDAPYNWVFIWDGHNPFWNGRVVNYGATYPGGLVGQIHTDGQIWATAMMKVWDAIGKTKSDKSFWNGIGMTNSSASQNDAANAVYQAAIALGCTNTELIAVHTIFTNTGYTLPALPPPCDAPIAICQTATIQLDANGQAILAASDVDAGSSADCGLQSLTISPQTFSCADLSLTKFDAGETGVSTSENQPDYTLLSNPSWTNNTNSPLVITASQNGVTITAEATGSNNSQFRDRGIGGPLLTKSNAALLRDFIAQDGLDAEIKVTLSGLPAGTFEINSFHYDWFVNGFPNPFDVFVDDANGSNQLVVGNTDFISSPAPYTGEVFSVSSDGMNDVVIYVRPISGEDRARFCGLTIKPVERAVTLTITDINGASDQCITNVLVEDIAAPTVSCQAVTVQLDTDGGSTLYASQVDNGSSDACGIASVLLQEIFEQPMFNTSFNNLGHGQSFTAPFSGDLTSVSILVNGNSSGRILHLYNSSTGSGTAFSIGTPAYSETGVDLVDSDGGTIWSQIPLSIPFPIVAGNQYSFVIEDFTDIYYNDFEAYSGGSFIYGYDLSSGCCTWGDIPFQLVINTESLHYSCADIGLNTKVLIVTDNNGNTSSCQTTVTVVDEIAPSVSCGSQQLNILSNPDFEAGPIAPGIEDWLVFGNVFTENIDPFNGAQHAKMFGNFSGGFNVSGAYQVVPANPGETYIASAYMNNLSSDAMSGANEALVKIEFRDAGGNILAFSESAVLNASSPTDTWTLYSTTGTAPPSTAEIQYLLLFLQPGLDGGAAQFDAASLKLTPSGDITVQLDGNGLASIQASDIHGSSNDNCGIDNMTLVPNTFDCSHVGTQSVTLTATDLSGNTNTCTTTVTIERTNSISCIWTGAVDADWFIDENWSNGCAPDFIDDVLIPAAPSIQPHLASGSSDIRSLTLENGASLLVDGFLATSVSSGDAVMNNGTITVNGTLEFGGGDFVNNGLLNGTGTIQEATVD